MILRMPFAFALSFAFAFGHGVIFETESNDVYAETAKSRQKRKESQNDS